MQVPGLEAAKAAAALGAVGSSLGSLLGSLNTGAGDSSGMTKAVAPPGINSHFDPKRLAEDSD